MAGSLTYNGASASNVRACRADPSENDATKTPIANFF